MVLTGAIWHWPDPSSSDDKVTLRQLNSRQGIDLGFPDMYQRRVSRFDPMIAAVFGFALALGVMRLRRLELASIRHLGARRWEQALQASIECLCWSSATTALCSDALALWARLTESTGPIVQLGVIVLTTGDGSAA